MGTLHVFPECFLWTGYSIFLFPWLCRDVTTAPLISASAFLPRIRATASPSLEAVLIPCTFLPLCHLSTPVDILCGLSPTAEDTFLAGYPSPSGTHLHEVERHPQPMELWPHFVLTIFQPASLMSHRNVLQLGWKTMKISIPNLCHPPLFILWDLTFSYITDRVFWYMAFRLTQRQNK